MAAAIDNVPSVTDTELLAEAGRLAQVGGWSLDLATETVSWTAATRAIHEVGTDYQPTAASLVDFYEPEVRPVVQEALHRARTSGEPFDLELPFVTTRNIALWVRFAGQAYHEGSEIRRIGGFVQDVTLRRRTEDLMRHQRDEAQRLVAEHAAADTRQRELDRLKGEFLATMSHEIRTPLNSIVGFTGILLKGLAGPTTDEQQKQLGLVRDSARRLLALVNDFLDLSRLDAGRLALQKAPFDFATVVAEVLTELHPAAEAKQLTLRQAGTDAPCPLVGDRHRVRQILCNLVDNAVKFTERGEVEVSVRTESGRLIVAVSDTGIGIRPDQLPQLFEAFRQLDTSAHRRHEGTGLGLHLSRRLLEALGGTIRVASQPGIGSTFTFTIPAAPP